MVEFVKISNKEACELVPKNLLMNLGLLLRAGKVEVIGYVTF